MKQLLCIFLGLTLLTTQTLAQTAVNLRNGTPLRIRINTETDSKRCLLPMATIDNDVLAEDGKLLIRRGTVVDVQQYCEKAAGCGKPGTISLDFLSTVAADGTPVLLKGNKSIEGEDRQALALGLGIGLGIFLFPFGFAFLAIKGEQARLQPMVVQSVVVDGNYSIR